MLTAITGERWKQLRSKLSPVFTSGKLRLMVPKLDRVGEDMIEHLNGLAEEGARSYGTITLCFQNVNICAFPFSGKDLEAKDVMTKYTLDAIATCGFGVEINSFKSEGAFAKMVSFWAKISPSKA